MGVGNPKGKVSYTNTQVAQLTQKHLSTSADKHYPSDTKLQFFFPV